MQKDPLSQLKELSNVRFHKVAWVQAINQVVFTAIQYDNQCKLFD